VVGDANLADEIKRILHQTGPRPGELEKAFQRLLVELGRR
jgi:hypothetical protein